MAGMLELERSRTRRERTFIGSECAVCEEPLEHTLRGERILQFSCGHVSHEACFYEYIKEFESQYCPTCNAPLGLDTSRGGNVLDLGMLHSLRLGSLLHTNTSQRSSAALYGRFPSITKLENSSNGVHKTHPRPGMARPYGTVHEVGSRTTGPHSEIAESPNPKETARKARENGSKDMVRDPAPPASNMHATAARAQLPRRRRVIMVLRVTRKAVAAMITMFSPWKQT